MVGNIDGNGGEGSTSIPLLSPVSPQPSSIQPTHDPLPGHFATGGEISTSHPPSKPPLSPLHPQSSSISASHDSPSVHLGTGGEDSSSHPPSKPQLSPIAPELSSITANHDTPPVHFGTGGEGSTSHSPSKPPQSLLPQQPSSITANHDTPAVHFGQISRRRSPRLLDCNNGGTDSSFDINRMPKKKKPRITESFSSSFPSSVSFLIGDPVPDEVARRKWPWRYDCQEPKSNGPFPKTNNSDDDEDKLVLNVKCHYLQAKIEANVFDLGDYATVKGEEGGHDHVGKILEFFKTNNNEDFFRIQWFFRAEDTVIKDEASSHDKKRLFYSTLMNDNPLDCIVSKVKVLKVPPSVCSKPPCDYYYDMKYNIDYSTFSTIKDDVESDTCCMSTSPNKEEIHSNGSKINVNGTIITKLKPKKLELTLLDMYSGCGGMSTGLCFGAKASGVDIKTKWAVDANTDACESLRQNHPKTQIRNEAAEDFLDLIKEWDKLCKKHLVKEEKNQDQDSLPADSADDVSIPSKPDRNVAEDEYEVENFVDICYSDLGGKKRGIKFKVRWAGYGPSDDTWEPIQELSKCEDKIHEFVKKGTKANILPRPGDVDIICGGPPCQGISGYNRHRNFESPLEDERNYQIVVFMEIINFLNPKYVLMENVADILRFANGRLARYAVSCLVKNYYQTRLGIMAAGCYGLPQFRLRVFLWGARADVNLPPFPLPTHDAVLKYGPPTGFERNVVAYDKGQARDLEECVLLKDAISDLPPVSNSEIREEMTYKSDPETEFQKYIRATKSEMLGIPCGSSCVKKCVLYDHRPVQLNEDDYLRVCRIPKRKGANIKDLPGIIVDDDYTVTRIPEAELMPSGKHWVPEYAMNLYERKNPKSFARLWWDETVSTVFCLPNFRVEAVLHPEQDRVLTIRENARLQGFPDFYTLCGSVNQRYRQVGNAVAVPVGRALGYTLGSAFQKLTGDEPLTTLPPKFSHSTTIQLLQPLPSATTVSL